MIDIRLISGLFFSVFFSVAVFAQDVKILWQSDSTLRHPESIVFDAKRNCLYVSNMDKNTPLSELYTDPVSRISIDGEIVETEWMKGFSSPTGLILKNDTLYIVEKNGIVLVDVENEKVLRRIPIETNGFLNDITIDERGRIFVSETEKEGVIYLIENGQPEIWLKSLEIGSLNGIFADGDDLILGVNADHYLKKVSLETKKLSNIVYLGEGNIDGIQKTISGNYLVSHFMGNLYAVSPDGGLKEIFHSRNQNLFIADFAYIPELQIIVIPSLRTNHIFTLRYEE